MTQLLHSLASSDREVRRWQDVEALVVDCCRQQDPKCVHNKETDPDVKLSNGWGVEVKSTTSLTRGINLNSAAPDSHIFYAFVYYRFGKIKNVGIVSGANFFCQEVEEIKKVNTSLRKLSNPHVKYRTRIMWQVKSPFEIWGVGNFVVDNKGAVSRY
jgi:hypothetical protein